MQPTLSPAVADTPFRLHTAPSEAVAHPGWQQARAAALAALGRGEVVVLLGLPGTGKTLLLQDLAQTLRHEGWSVRLIDRGDALHPDLRADVLLVDEAGRMDADALARLCATDMPFILAALPGFTERLAGLPRPITPVTLEPLPPEEIARFVAARLSATGRPGGMLESDAVLALARHSGGLLRLVNLLAGTAVFLAELERAPRVCRRHVDEAASMRDGVHEDVAPTVRAEAPPARHAPLPARRRRAALEQIAGWLGRDGGPASPRESARSDKATAFRVPTGMRNAVAAAAAGLGLALAGGWAVSGWLDAPSPSAQPSGPDRNAERSPDIAGNQPVGARPHATVGDAASPATENSRPPQREEQPPRQADRAAPSRPDVGTSSSRRPAAPAASASFRGPVHNATLRQGGQMSLVIRRRGPSGAITARFEAWGGLLGSGELAGTLSDDGRISVSGPLMVGKNPFICDLSGLVAGSTLTGSATFVRSSGGRVSRSTFTLTRS